MQNANAIILVYKYYNLRLVIHNCIIRPTRIMYNTLNPLPYIF
jgi:hypothetical protein